MASSVPYDPYPGNSANTNTTYASPGNNKLSNIKGELDDSIQIMNQNVQAMATRGERLESLEDKTHQLTDSTNQFKRGASEVRKRMWMKNTKMKICLVVGVIILIIIIVVPIATHFSK